MAITFQDYRSVCLGLFYPENWNSLLCCYLALDWIFELWRRKMLCPQWQQKLTFSCTWAFVKTWCWFCTEAIMQLAIACAVSTLTFSTATIFLAMSSCQLQVLVVLLGSQFGGQVALVKMGWTGTGHCICTLSGHLIKVLIRELTITFITMLIAQYLRLLVIIRHDSCQPGN